MQILEAEVNLREETRVTQQAREALDKEEYAQRAGELSKTQDALTKRVAELTVRIRELPDGDYALKLYRTEAGEVIVAAK